VRKKLIRRRTAKESRREVCISVSPRGAALVEDVLARRRAAIDSILARMPPSAHAPLARGLKAFVDAGAGLEQVSATVG
jgi:DNA-binding MarR family transcriptional regulator